MPMPLKINTAVTLNLMLRNKTGEPATGCAGLVAFISKDSGLYNPIDGTEAEIGKGVYEVPLTADEMNATEIVVILTTTTADVPGTRATFTTVTKTIDDFTFA